MKKLFVPCLNSYNKTNNFLKTTLLEYKPRQSLLLLMILQDFVSSKMQFSKLRKNIKINERKKN